MQKQFTLFMFLGFIAFLAIFLFVVMALSPDKGLFGVISFFFSLTFLVICLFSLLAFLVRKKRTNNEIYFTNMKTSVREGFLLAFFVDITLVLAAMKLLTWWDAFLLAGSLLLLELYFQSERSSHKLQKDGESKP